MDPLVAEMLALLERYKKGEILRRAGVAKCTVGQWRKGQNPNVANARAVLNAMGYDIAVVRRTPETVASANESLTLEQAADALRASMKAMRAAARCLKEARRG